MQPNLATADATPGDPAFVAEVRAWLAANLPDDIRERWLNGSALFTVPEDARRWQRILHSRGWAAPHWPAEYGGPGWDVRRQHLFEMTCAEAGAPPVMATGTFMIGPVLMKFGTPEQKVRFLPRVLACDDYWCQGYSEPGSGSDLASLKTRAERDGDHYVVNGSKIWTSHAHAADWMFALVRTSTEGKPQQGISFLMLPMTTPGISVRPLITIGNDHELNQVFFDDVRVPVSLRVGDENDGWTVAKYLLEFERGGNFSGSWLMANLVRLRGLARLSGANRDPAFRQRVAEAEIEAETLQIGSLRMLSRLSAGGNPGPESSVAKLRGSEVNELVTELTMMAAGEFAIPLAPFDAANAPGPHRPEEVEAANRYFENRAMSIMGGSSEVQKNILAKVVLGL
ncbi:MAG: acyl-CoA dehydrogenase family protein [Alphaproteobacteria bacterium]|nr:acyl-CoA dehydrogenase family protein [Alphaproteobacteria bacterium]MCB9930867.1 acyl-CoA dehydrogenase family protein [Alphaproteobacteria bacterium]